MKIKQIPVLAAVSLFVSALLLAGCNTAKGAATGVACTADGAVKDVKTAGSWVIRADNWIKKNLW